MNSTGRLVQRADNGRLDPIILMEAKDQTEIVACPIPRLALRK